VGRIAGVGVGVGAAETWGEGAGATGSRGAEHAPVTVMSASAVNELRDRAMKR
jgi:hypothetical protein